MILLSITRSDLPVIVIIHIIMSIKEFVEYCFQSLFNLKLKQNCNNQSTKYNTIFLFHYFLLATF